MNAKYYYYYIIYYRHRRYRQKVISKRGDTNWPSPSPDLSSVDFFLWGYLKSKVFKSNPATLKKLKKHIHEEMQNISGKTCQSVIENFYSRLQQCQNNQGSHMNDVILKKMESLFVYIYNKYTVLILYN